MPPSRRSFVSALAFPAVAGLAGCLSDTDARATDAADSTGSSTTPGSTASATADSAFTLRLAALESIPTDAPVRVHPRALARFLARGVDAEEAVRTHDGILLEGSRPILPRIDAARLSGERVDDGPYTLDLTGGLRYRWLFGATPVESTPENATVIDVDELPTARRDLALAAIGDGRPQAYPETPLGTWARRTFVGGYLRHEGTVYRGREVQQTDAAFFADEVWYVGRATPRTDAPADAPHLLLDPLPDGARRAVDGLLSTWADSRDPVETDVSDIDQSARTALRDAEALLTHVAAFEVTVE